MYTCDGILCWHMQCNSSMGDCCGILEILLPLVFCARWSQQQYSYKSGEELWLSHKAPALYIEGPRFNAHQIPFLKNKMLSGDVKDLCLRTRRTAAS